MCGRVADSDHGLEHRTDGVPDETHNKLSLDSFRTTEGFVNTRFTVDFVDPPELIHLQHCFQHD